MVCSVPCYDGCMFHPLKYSCDSYSIKELLLCKAKISGINQSHKYQQHMSITDAMGLSNEDLPEQPNPSSISSKIGATLTPGLEPNSTIIIQVLTAVSAVTPASDDDNCNEDSPKSGDKSSMNGIMTTPGFATSTSTISKGNTTMSPAANNMQLPHHHLFLLACHHSGWNQYHLLQALHWFLPVATKVKVQFNAPPTMEIIVENTTVTTANDEGNNAISNKVFTWPLGACDAEEEYITMTISVRHTPHLMVQKDSTPNAKEHDKVAMWCLIKI